MLLRSLHNGEQKKLVRDVVVTFATTHTGLVHDVTDADYSAQSGSSQGRDFATGREIE